MRPVAFALCFAFGVSLMVWSGYLPKSATARTNDTVESNTDVSSAELSLSRFPVRPTGMSDAYIDVDLADEPPIAEPDADTTPGDESDTLVTVNAESVNPEDADDAAAALAALGEGLEAGPPDDPNLAVDESEPNAPELPAFAADAGPDRVVWLGWNEFTLDGTASRGEGLSYDWVQIEGPLTLQIANRAAAKTTATGIAARDRYRWFDQVYVFELMVVDAEGHEAYDKVRITVRAAPELIIEPAPQRWFAERDGYTLGHYESWVTNLDTYESTFRVYATGELTLTPVEGQDYTIERTQTTDGYVYTITLTGNDDVDATAVEFLVDSAEKIPGILRLGVSWVE